MAAILTRNTKPLVIGLLILGAMLPIGLYLYTIGLAPSVSQEQARSLLYKGDGTALLVDIRTPEEFARGHLKDAVNWPYEAILKQLKRAGTPLPNDLRNRQLLLWCDSGILAAVAAWRLNDTLNVPAFNVSGGMEAWIAATADPKGEDARFISPAGAANTWFRTTPSWLQTLQVITGFMIKPTYMLIAVFLFLLLRKSTAPDLKALAWAMVFFFAGELFCALNYLLFTHGSHLFEFFHSYGMLLCMSFATYALATGVDQRLLGMTDGKTACFAQSICRRCIKHTETVCGARNFFLVIMVLALGISAIPLTTDLKFVSYNTRIYDVTYNYSHPVIHQIFEQKYCPLYAILLLAIGIAVLKTAPKAKGMKLGKLFFSAAMGPLGFGFFRTFLFHLYDDNLVWLDFWEESTELLFVVAAGLMLWFFREPFFKNASED